GESIANDLLACKGASDSFGWSLDLEQENQLNELNGEDYIFDLINEIENKKSNDSSISNYFSSKIMVKN
ncbi:MAG: hypothetical protein QOK90_09525, partial [Nitrososphaeraceae archaeon]|nr:hypothetical protein [Nitrososphaeraceae archaeon]